MTNQKFCITPFTSFCVEKHSAHPCVCGTWLKQNIGSNFNSSSLHETLKSWHSSIFDIFRESVRSRTYQFCDKHLCPMYIGLEIKEIKPGLFDLTEDNANKIKDYLQGKDILFRGIPSVLKLDYDLTCNLACPTCRKSIFTDNTVDKVWANNVKPYLRTISRLIISGRGEVFASKAYMSKLSKPLVVGPEFKGITLMTNAQLLKDSWNLIPSNNLIDKIFISIDATTKEVYEQIRRNGIWERLLESLEFVLELRKNNKIKKLQFTFVIQKNNLHQAVEFIDFAKQYSVDKVCYNNTWCFYNGQPVRSQAVNLPTAPEYRTYLEIEKILKSYNTKELEVEVNSVSRPLS